MAGSAARGHHFIPQFLLRGFSARSRKKEFFSYYFRANHPPVETNLRNIAKVRDFHGEPGQPSLERRLSEIENHQAQLARKLRTGECPRRSEAVASLVASVQVRSENIRKVMSESGRRFLSLMGQKMNSNEVRERLTSGIIQELQDRFESGYYQNQVAEGTDLDPDYVKSTFESIHARLRVEVDTFMGGFINAIGSTDFEGAANKSHLRVLNEDPTPPARVEQLTAFNWHVRRTQRTAILGDVCVLADRGQTLPLSNMLSVEDRFDAVYLPLSTDAILIGSLQDAYEPRSLEELNKASAELSAQFFVSASTADLISPLGARIGARMPLMSDEEMRSQLPDFSMETIRQAFLEERQREIASQIPPNE